MDYADSIDNYQQEVFDFLINKQQELKKQDIELYFSFDITDLKTNFNNFENKLLEIKANQILQNKYFLHYKNFIYISINKFLISLTKESIFFAYFDDDNWINFLIEEKLNYLKIENIASIQFNENWQEGLNNVLNIYLKFYNYVNLKNKNYNFKNYFKIKYNEIVEFKNNFKRLSVSDILIKNTNGINDILIENIDENNQWLFFTGENSFGKTTILQIITTYLDEKLNDSKPEKNEILNQFQIDKNENNVEILYNTGYKKGNSELPDFITAYGPHRLTMSSESFENENPNKHIFATGYNIPLQNIELQLSRWYYKQDRFPEFKEKYENVVKILLKLLPNVSKIEISKDDKVYYHETDKNGEPLKPITFDKLASGMKGIIAFVGDLILRFFKSQKLVNNPADFVGIVIIDELDLHLHPKWQIKFPTLLSDIFPKLQFIASTHSPFPLLGATENSVAYAVERDAKNGITVKQLSENIKNDVSKIDISTLLIHFFNDAPIISQDIKQKIERFYFLKSKTNLTTKENEELQNIDSILNDSFIGSNIHDLRYLKFLEVLKKLGIDSTDKIMDIELNDEELMNLKNEFSKYYSA